MRKRPLSKHTIHKALQRVPSGKREKCLRQLLLAFKMCRFNPSSAMYSISTVMFGLFQVYFVARTDGLAIDSSFVLFCQLLWTQQYNK